MTRLADRDQRQTPEPESPYHRLGCAKIHGASPRKAAKRLQPPLRHEPLRGRWEVLAGALDKDITVEGEMISSEALKNALSKPSCISISSTAKPIPSLDRSSRGLFANKFRQASGTNPLDMSGPRHIPIQIGRSGTALPLSPRSDQ